MCLFETRDKIVQVLADVSVSCIMWLLSERI